uniref:Secreted protein n=1 Tax=Echinococcus granulosus TaxID=6210 RepID=A0A068X4M8_ECHGR|nr:hypothetical protein EgrG_000314600 [Echinococcus granulosus]
MLHNGLNVFTLINQHSVMGFALISSSLTFTPLELVSRLARIPSLRRIYILPEYCVFFYLQGSLVDVALVAAESEPDRKGHVWSETPRSPLPDS